MLLRAGFVGRQLPRGLAGQSLGLDLTSGVLDSRITFTRAGATATYFNSSGLITGAAANAPRFDYEPVSKQLRGLLIEESRINNVPTAIPDNSAAWSTTLAVITTNATTAPDGTSTASLIVDNATLGQHSTQTSGTIAYTAGTSYSYSIYAKQNTSWGLQIFGGGAVYTALSCFANFNLSNGTIGTVSGTNSSATMVPVGNGWYRCTLSVTADTSASTVSFALALTNNNNIAARAPNYAGTGLGLYVWGAQEETGAFATSYIPTTAGAVTRNADSATMPLGSWYNQVAGTFDTEFIPAQVTASGTQAGVIRWDDGTNNNSAGSFIASSNQLFGSATIATVLQLNVGLGAPAYGAINKQAISYGGPLWQTQAGAGAVSNGSGGAVASTMNRLIIGGTNVTPGIWNLNGWIRRIKYWPRALFSGEMLAENNQPSLDIGFIDPAGGLPPSITFTRASIGTYFDINKQLVTAASGAPRFDHDPVTGVPLGLLIEESRTNSFIQSSFQSGWGGGATGVITAANAALAPDGSITALSLVQAPTTNTEHYIQQTVAGLAANAVYTVSLYVKPIGGPCNIGLSLFDTTAPANVFHFRYDLGAGAVVPSNGGTGTVGTGTIQQCANGWYRITGSAQPSTIANTGVFARIRLYDPSSNSVFQGDGVSGFYVWGAQLEAGAFATSYIPTTAATVTRVDEIATFLLGPWYNQLAGAMVSEASHGGIRPTTFPRIVQMDDNTGSNNNAITHVIAASGGRVYSNGNVGGVQQWAIGPNGVYANNTIFKVGSSWVAGSQLVDVNAANPSSAGGASVPSLAIMRIGRDTGNILQSMWFRRIRYWPRVLTSGELQAATR